MFVFKIDTLGVLHYNIWSYRPTMVIAVVDAIGTSIVDYTHYKNWVYFQ